MSIRKLKSRGIGRLELLAWLNEFLETDYTKIEHLADGIAYCQIFDALYRGKVALHQVNFQAKSVMDYERNFNVLNRAFQACEIRKEIPIRKLVQGIFQEHFEFLHWVHDHVHRTYPDALHSYRGFARRQQVLGSAVSLTQLNSTNSNLVPKFSNSTRRSRESYIESPSPELGGTRNLLDHSTFSLDNLEESNAPETNEKCENSTGPIAVEEAETLPAMLMFVQHSYSSTIQAQRILGLLEPTLKQILSPIEKANAKKTKPNPVALKTPPSTTAGKTRPPTETNVKPKKLKATNCDDPSLAYELQALADTLEAELMGRVKDFKYLEESIDKLVDELRVSATPIPPTKSSTS